MNKARTLGLALGTLALMAVFIALGFWQLDRAAQLKELQRPYQEKPMVDLVSVARPASNLSGDSVNRIVHFSGKYVIQLEAPNQRDSNGKINNWSVGLMEVDGGGAILVVRSDHGGENPPGDITVIGRLFPRQYEDRAPSQEGSLSRIDPALVSSMYSADLFDGFVVASSEVRNGSAIKADRVDLRPAKPTVPGFYWQHITYVAIWWLMALVVLFLPFYGRWRKKQ